MSLYSPSLGVTDIVWVTDKHRHTCTRCKVNMWSYSEISSSKTRKYFCILIDLESLIKGSVWCQTSCCCLLTYLEDATCKWSFDITLKKQTKNKFEVSSFITSSLLGKKKSQTFCWALLVSAENLKHLFSSVSQLKLNNWVTDNLNKKTTLLTFHTKVKK